MNQQSETLGRTDQKATTRTILVQAAIELTREGRLPPISEAAEQVQVSVATAYRYIPSKIKSVPLVLTGITYVNEVF